MSDREASGSDEERVHSDEELNEDVDETHEHDEDEDMGGAAGDFALAKAHVPKDLKQLRACKGCGLIKSLTQFQQDGCPNCQFPSSFGPPEYTTMSFEGFMASMNPRQSWAAKYQAIATLIPGIYALSVTGALMEELESHVINRGFKTSFCRRK